MGVIDLNQYRKKKDAEERIKKDMRDSLDNDKVKRAYNIPPPPPKTPTQEERLENIRKSVQRINAIMAELKEKKDE